MQRRTVMGTIDLSGILFVATALSLSMPCALAADDNDVAQAKEHIKAGESAAEKSDWDAAVKEFEEAVKITQNSAIAFYDLGIAQFHLGNLERAAEAEKRAILLDPHLVDAYVQLAAVLTKAEDYEGAERILERAVKLKPACETAKESLNELCKLKRQNPELFKKKKMTGLSEADANAKTGVADDSLTGAMDFAQSEKAGDSTDNTDKGQQPTIAPDLLERPRRRGPQAPMIESNKAKQAS